MPAQIASESLSTEKAHAGPAVYMSRSPPSNQGAFLDIVLSRRRRARSRQQVPISRPYVAASRFSSARSLHAGLGPARTQALQQLSRKPRDQKLTQVCVFPILVFLELSRSCKETRAFRVRYETIGSDFRPFLHKPNFTPLNPSAVERLFGGKLDEPAVRCVSDERRRLETYGTGRRLSERRPLEASRA